MRRSRGKSIKSTAYSFSIDCKLAHHFFSWNELMDSGATSARKYRALNETASALKTLSHNLLEEKMNKAGDRGFGGGISAF
jgi:hypothetical protein